MKLSTGREGHQSVAAVLASPLFASGLDDLAVRIGRDLDDVTSEVRKYLAEMVSEQGAFATRLWARWARFMYSGAYDLEVEPGVMDRVRELSHHHPLVFLPSHRSNLDPYVLAALLHREGMPPNRTLGGINMAFWPLGPVGRRVGVVFIRRSFRDNEVYRYVLERYLGFLAAGRFNLEWYMEGTRSRTGKLLPPRMGLLNYLADAVGRLDCPDVYLVPTSIVYDVLPEVAEMTAESRGRSKEPEGLAWLIQYVRHQRKRIGSVSVAFGEPLNLVGAIRSLTPAAGDDDNENQKLVRSKIAFEVCVRINRATAITGTSLLLFTLLGVEERALGLREVCNALDPVLSYALVRDIPLDRKARALQTESGVMALLDTLVQHRVVELFRDGCEPVYRVGPDQLLVASFYRNSIAHWFVTRAIVELTVLAAARPNQHVSGADAGLDRAWSEALALRDLLKFEFFFPDKAGFAESLTAEMKLVRADWRDCWVNERETVGKALVESGLLVAHRTVRSFLEAYWVVAQQLVRLGSDPADEDRIVQDSLGLAEQYRLQHRISSAEAVSTHLFRTGLKLAHNRSLMEAGPEAGSGRLAFLTQLSDVLARIAEIHDLDRHQHGVP